MKNNRKTKKWLSIILGSLITSYILYIRVIREKVPKELIENLYEKGYYIQLIFFFILIITFIILLGITLSQKIKK